MFLSKTLDTLLSTGSIQVPGNHFDIDIDVKNQRKQTKTKYLYVLSRCEEIRPQGYKT